MGCRRLETSVHFYTAQSFVLVLLAILTGLLGNSAHPYWVAGISLVGKCILIPKILLLVIQKVKMKREVETYISLPTSMLIGGILILLSYHFIPSLPTNLSGENIVTLNEILKAGVSLVLIGLFLMITRKKAFNQILGLYVLDNGIFCLTIATIFEMPFVIEMGLFFELLLGAMVMGILVYRIKQSFDTVNVVHLKNLRG
jgi:hydrogenase-4 component E